MNQDLDRVRVGILGGGQLSLMLADAALKMGYRPVILAESSDSPAARAHQDVIFGSSEDTGALRWFFSQVDCVVFENEFVNCKRLEKVAVESQWSGRFVPSLETIARVQDKLRQKEILKALEIPTADYLKLDFKESPKKSKKNRSIVLRAELKRVLDDFGGSCVLKWAKMGYDGKGVLFLEDSVQSLERAEKFCLQAQKIGSPVYAERKIEFLRELAVIGVYSVTGTFVAYPLVISEQSEGICSKVMGPAVALGVSPEREGVAQQIAERIARALSLEGSFAIEFFETPQGELWVNEIAPRVHNSGHYTQDACATDQFENHWRAVLGVPLGSPLDLAQTGPGLRSPCFAMLNFLGPSKPLPSRPGPPSGVDSSHLILPVPGPRSHIHWYGKTEIRPLRKLGHVTGTVEQPHELGSLLDELETCRDQWLFQILKRVEAP